MTDGAAGIQLSHNVWIDFPDTRWGRLCQRVVEKAWDGRQAVQDHTDREVCDFKAQLEAAPDAVASLDRARAAVPGRVTGFAVRTVWRD